MKKGRTVRGVSTGLWLVGQFDGVDSLGTIVVNWKDQDKQARVS